MRLDWFLPALRRSPDGRPGRNSWIRRTAHAVLPSAALSDYRTKRRGKIRQLLRRLGPSWLYSPLRRITQTICLLLFLWSFLYVCWPYTARPDPPPRSSRNWHVVDLDQQTGQISMAGPRTPDWIGPGRDTVFLVDRAALDDALSGGSTEQPTMPFRLTATGPTSMTLTPIDELPPQVWDRLLLNQRGWDLQDQPAGRWPSHYADDLVRKEHWPAELFLVIDPLLSISTAIASRQWVWSLLCAVAILAVCVVVPRGFCGYLCPLGTTIDLFDYLVGKRVQRFRVRGDGWWVHTKYYVLAACLLCAAAGILITGYVAAIPVITRGLLFSAEPAQTALLRGPHLVAPWNLGHYLSLGLFIVVLGLGLLQPRFWCKYVCPSGAVFSLGNLLRVSQRHVESSCIHCNKCIEVCPFDAIKPDFTTRVTDCTLCQTCGGVCPTHAIKFVERNNLVQLKVFNEPSTGETVIGRRGFVSLAVGSSLAAGGSLLAAGARRWGGDWWNRNATPPVRPPGSVPEREFLDMCIRCGECFKVCPNNVLQPMSLTAGLDPLWTPQVIADWAGCESSCNACGQVCPTGAIRALPLEEKRWARMGLALVNQQTCLPIAGQEACQLCVDECMAAGYEAIEFQRMHTQADANGEPIPDSGFLAPIVVAEKCVGCGLCQTRCYGINVQQRGVLNNSAIVIEAGPGKEDRLLDGSYRQRNDPRFAMPRGPVASPAPSGSAGPSSNQPVDSTSRDAPGRDAPDALPDPPGADDPFGLEP